MNIIKDNLRQLGLIIVLIALTMLFQVLTGGTFLAPANIVNLILQNSFILVLAIGMTFVIVTGRIDLSVGSVAAVAGALAGRLLIDMNVPVLLAIVIVLAFGALIGAFQGFWIAYKNIPFFVVTLAGMLMFRGLTMIVLDGRMIGPFPTGFQMMAAGFLPSATVLEGINLTTVIVCAGLAFVYAGLEIRSRQTSIRLGVTPMPMYLLAIKLFAVVGAITLFGYWFAVSNGIPNVLVVLFILVLAYSFVANRTILGRHIYATGSNPKTAELSGIKTRRIVFWVYVNMGLLASLAGMIFAARINVAMPRAGDGFELQAIAAAFIGGASPYGGVGKVGGAIVGAMVVGVLNNGMGILGVSVDMQLVVTGLVLLAAVIFDIFTKSRKAKMETVVSKA